MTLLPSANGMTNITHRLIRMVRNPLFPRIEANTFRNGGTGTFGDVGAACGQNSVNQGQAGVYDGLSILSGHEYAEAITDPFPASGWRRR